MTFHCPKCGYKDAPCWRTSRFVIYAVYCTLEELKEFEPIVAAKLEGQKRVILDGYVYYLRGRGNHVYRIAEELEDFTKSNRTEKYRQPLNPNQRRLLETTQP